MGQDLIDLQAEGTYGPAMRALPTDRQRRFVIALLELGSMNHKRAVAMAGYNGDDNTLAVTAHRLFHDDQVQAAVHEEATRRLSSAKIMAVSKLLEIADTAPEPKDRLKAVGMILNRVGMHEKTEHHVTTQDLSRTDEAMIERIKSLAGKLGLDQRALLGEAGVIDAEYTEVESSTEGIEDIL